MFLYINTQSKHNNNNNIINNNNNIQYFISEPSYSERRVTKYAHIFMTGYTSTNRSSIVRFSFVIVSQNVNAKNTNKTIRGV